MIRGSLLYHQITRPCPPFAFAAHSQPGPPSGPNARCMCEGGELHAVEAERGAAKPVIYPGWAGKRRGNKVSAESDVKRSEMGPFGVVDASRPPSVKRFS